MKTIYRIVDERGHVQYTSNTTEAEGYSRNGLKVTATTGEQL